jgi:hypothetical protein
MPELPEPYVQAQLHGGPHDGETVLMPWARLDLPMVAWLQEDLVESLYRLSGPWRGQSVAHYQFVEPKTEEKAA